MQTKISFTSWTTFMTRMRKDQSNTTNGKHSCNDNIRKDRLHVFRPFGFVFLLSLRRVARNIQRFDCYVLWIYCHCRWYCKETEKYLFFTAAKGKSGVLKVPPKKLLITLLGLATSERKRRKARKEEKMLRRKRTRPSYCVAFPLTSSSFTKESDYGIYGR